MKKIDMKKLFKIEINKKIIIFIISTLVVYLLISLYFANHYFFNTEINGINISLKAHGDADNVINSYIKDYKLKLIERDGETEVILGQDIGLQYNEKNDIPKINKIQSSYKWISSLLKDQDYYEEDLFLYNKDKLENKINELNCLNKEIIEPQNVRFVYSNGSYEVIKEVYGNKIYIDKLKESIKMSISKGKTNLDLNENSCYENPKYTIDYSKTMETKNLLNKYVGAKINYTFGYKNEILDGDIINQWLSVDENLEVMINKKAVYSYLNELSKKYDTVGIPREFKASTNKIIEIKGGFYGWKINCVGETKALLENIERGEILQKEPIYTQRALYREEDDIGNTYVEINITRQHLWFYKDGKLITQGDVVTGNPNRGNSTKLGIYMLNYKEKGSTLNGPGYESDVSYWMPFNGNIGIHDASWRYSFGGNIYKNNGSHGCVNAPLYLAKKIYDNIEPGTPVICYEE